MSFAIHRLNKYKHEEMLCLVLLALSLLAFEMIHAGEFNEPWKADTSASVIDPYDGNPIEWDRLKTDSNVVAIIHRASIGFRTDKLYLQRRTIAKERGYKWGSYHFGVAGDGVAQADFYLKTVGKNSDELIALDLESFENPKLMSIEGAVQFIEHIHKQTGRYPMVYANHNTTMKIISSTAKETFSKTLLWYARFRKNVPVFPSGVWESYTLWQFSSELNCKKTSREKCLYTVPGTAHDMDVNVFNGTREQLLQKWPLNR